MRAPNPQLVAWFLVTAPGALFAIPVLWVTIGHFTSEARASLRWRMARSHLRRALIDFVILWNGVAIGLIALFYPTPPAVPQTRLATQIVAAGVILIQLLVTIDVYLEYRLQRQIF